MPLTQVKMQALSISDGLSVIRGGAPHHLVGEGMRHTSAASVEGWELRPPAEVAAELRGWPSSTCAESSWAVDVSPKGTLKVLLAAPGSVTASASESPATMPTRQ